MKIEPEHLQYIQIFADTQKNRLEILIKIQDNKKCTCDNKHAAILTIYSDYNNY